MILAALIAHAALIASAFIYLLACEGKAYTQAKDRS